MARDPFTYFLELRRKYVRDWYWFAAAVVVMGFGITFSSGKSHLIGTAAGAGVMLIGLFVGYLGHRRGLPLSASQHSDSTAKHHSAIGPTEPKS